MKQKLEKGKKSFLNMPIAIKSIDKDNYTLTMVASTQDPDRHGDTVVQSGWDLSQFNKNPVILNSHNYGDVTEVIAKATRTEIVGSGKKAKLEQDWKFAVNENPKAKIAWELYAGGFLSASSVGFIPKKFKQNKDGTTDWWTIEEAELLEVSAVSVPANARALAKSKGIDVDAFDQPPEEDEEDKITPSEDIPEDALEDTENAPESEEGAEEDTDIDNEEEDPAEEDEEDKENTDTDPEPELVEETPEEPTEETPEEKPVQASYKSQVAKAISSIETKEKQKLRKAAEIINSLLNGSHERGIMDKKTQDQVRKRKMNQAIRMLIESK